MSNALTIECRKAFEKWNADRGVSNETDFDAWYRPRYKHSHVDSMWHGFQEGWKLAKSSEYTEVKNDNK
jgi:hypothetical protein